MPLINDTPTKLVGDLNAITKTITSGTQVLDEPIFPAGNTILAITITSSFTVGDIYFLASLTGVPGTFYQLTDSTVTIYKLPSANITTAISGIVDSGAGIQIPLDPTVFDGVQFLQIYCSNSQSVDQNVQFIMGPVLGS